MKNLTIDYTETIITLPDLPALKGRLREKLAEYRRRIEKYKRDYAIDKVGIVVDHEGNLLDALYKAAIVEELLKAGQVRVGDLHQRLAREFKGHLAEEQFTNAVSVIDDYIRTGGTRTKGSTRFFNADLFHSILGESAVIEYPQEDDRRGRLRRKYHEYLGRIADYERSVERTVDLDDIKRAQYKVRIIQELRDHRRVELPVLAQALEAEDPGAFNKLEFARAGTRVRQLLEPGYAGEDTRPNVKL